MYLGGADPGRPPSDAAAYEAWLSELAGDLDGGESPPGRALDEVERVAAALQPDSIEWQGDHIMADEKGTAPQVVYGDAAPPPREGISSSGATGGGLDVLDCVIIGLGIYLVSRK
jgi:hypothetical protein